MGKVFTVSYNPFFRRVVQFTIRTTARITRNTPASLTLKLRQNVVYDVTNVEQRELLGFDVGRPLSDAIPKRVNSLAAVSSKPQLQRGQSGMSARPALL